MASPLTTVAAALETEWEALVPPDRTAVTYRHVEGPDRHEGSSGDRVFWFDPPRVSTPVAERGAAATEYEHVFDARIRLILEGQTRRALFNRIANEGALLVRAVDKKAETTWGAGILNVITEGTTFERENDDGILTIAIRAYTEEAD